MRIPIVRKSLLMISAALAVAACSNDKSGPTKRVSVDGNTYAIATDGAKHVAYIVGPTAAYTGDSSSG